MLDQELQDRLNTLVQAVQADDGPESGRAAIDVLRPVFATIFAQKWSVSKAAGEVIARSLSPVAAPSAIKWLGLLATDQSHEMRCLATWALGRWGQDHPEEIVPLAYRLAADESWEVREMIANVFDDLIGPQHPEFVFGLMERWADDADPNIRRVPTNALMRYGRRYPERVLDLMERLLHDDSAYVRRNVAFCLQQSIGKKEHPILGPGQPHAPQLLLERLDQWTGDADPRVRWIVATTIGNVWAADFIDRALAIIERLTTDPDRRVQTARRAALKTLTKYRPNEVRLATEK